MKKVIFILPLLVFMFLISACGNTYVFARASIIENNHQNYYSFYLFKGEYNFSHLVSSSFSIQTDIEEGDLDIIYYSSPDSKETISTSVKKNGTYKIELSEEPIKYFFTFKSEGAKGKIVITWE